MLQYVILCLSILYCVHGLDERSREHIIKRFGKCLDEFKMTPEDLIKTREADMDPCFMACYFKEIQIMNDKGMLNVEKANEISESPTDDRPMRMIKMFPKLCKEVNDKEVSDGDKGCERAKMIAECYTDVAKKMYTARIHNRD